ncbi:MAG: DUF4190 domain-containing protein [Actinomycetota bacterium]|nr:DUF4190 domain-containing protein [Actinomycetota bacterium]
MASDPVDSTSDPDRSAGLLPPDGVAWPPTPPPVTRAARSLRHVAHAPAEELPSVLSPTESRPDDSHVDDWRTMAIAAPDGYTGSATAPPAPAQRVDAWSVASLVLAVVGLAPPLWATPLASLLAVALGLVGRRVCAVDPTRRGRVVATVGMLMGIATLAGIGAAAVGGSLTLFG